MNPALWYRNQILPHVNRIRGATKIAEILDRIQITMSNPGYTFHDWRDARPYAWEPFMVRAIQQRVDEDTVFVDIGAYHGFYTILASDRGCKAVYSFEPDPSNRDVLLANMEENRADCTVIPKAVSNGSGTIRVETQGTSKNQVSDSGRTVPCVSLDEFFSDRTAPDVIKVDVEGWELPVLRGATDLLDRAEPELFVEFHSEHGFAEGCEFLEQKGYTVDVLGRRGGEIFARGYRR